MCFGSCCTNKRLAVPTLCREVCARATLHWDLYVCPTPAHTVLWFIELLGICATVVTVSHRWSQTCSEVQILMVRAVQEMSGCAGENEAKRLCLPHCTPSFVAGRCHRPHVKDISTPSSASYYNANLQLFKGGVPTPQTACLYWTLAC